MATGDVDTNSQPAIQKFLVIGLSAAIFGRTDLPACSLFSIFRCRLGDNRYCLASAEQLQ